MIVFSFFLEWMPMFSRFVRCNAFPIRSRLFSGTNHVLFRAVPSSRFVHASRVSPDPFCPTIPTLKHYYEFLRITGALGNLKDTVVDATVHNLGTNRDLLRMLLPFGASIFNTGKVYSDHEGTIQGMIKDGIHCRGMHKLTAINSFDELYAMSLYEQQIAINHLVNNNPNIVNLIRLADGPETLQHPTKLATVVIQQTTQGNDVSATLRYPAIYVSESAAKSIIESQLIVIRIVERFFEKLANYPDFINRKDLQIGILGLGKMGFALVQELAKYYDHFILYDKDQAVLKQRADDLRKQHSGKLFNVAGRVGTILSNADVAFGATGTSCIDLDQMDAFQSRSKGPLMLVSCSSRTIEFQELIKLIAKEDATRREFSLDLNADRFYQNGFRVPLILLQSGMPFPFNQSEHALPARHADLVRTLKAIAFTFASWLCKNKEAGVPIVPVNYIVPRYLAAYFTKYWVDHLPEEDRKMIRIPEELFNPDYVRIHSGMHNHVHEEFDKQSLDWLAHFIKVIEAEKETTLTTSFRR